MDCYVLQAMHLINTYKEGSQNLKVVKSEGLQNLEDRQ